jgi:hemerythrin
MIGLTQEEHMLDWSHDYEIGNPKIDFEHHIFFGLIKEFHNARLNESDRERLGRILEEVALYARFHFRSEENLMKDIRIASL